MTKTVTAKSLRRITVATPVRTRSAVAVDNVQSAKYEKSESEIDKRMRLFEEAVSSLNIAVSNLCDRVKPVTVSTVVEISPPQAEEATGSPLGEQLKVHTARLNDNVLWLNNISGSLAL